MKNLRLLIAILSVVCLLLAACTASEEEVAEEPGGEEPTGEQPADLGETAATGQDGTATPAGEPTEGGTVIFAHEQEPGILNPMIPEGGGGASSRVGGFVHRGSYVINPNYEYVPLVLAEDAEVTDDPFTVTYTIRDEATWSDGTDLTAEDYVFTYETIMNPEWDIANRGGYELITDYEILDDKRVTFTFEENYASYRNLFDLILPKHDLEGENFNEAWRDDVPVSSGPFVVESWDRGQQMTLVRNENYFAGGPLLDRVIVRFLSETSTLLQQLRGGEIHAFDPQPQIDIIEAVDEMDGVVADVKAAVVTEHFRFNFDRPPLDEQYVRQAIMMSIDREALVETLMRPVDPNAIPPQNFVYAPGNPSFEEHYGIYEYDPQGAIALLEENGCERDDDDVFVCEGERLDFGYVSTTGNERRELMFEIVQAYASEIGVQLNADFSEASVQFGERLPSGDFDLMNHGTPMQDPGNMLPFFGCGGDVNFPGYCNEEVTELLEASDQAIDEAERAELLNEADALIAEDLPLIPLLTLPRMVVYDTTAVGGINVSPGTESISGMYANWNAEDWYAVE
jgi:peptide/nickel transport system substrate-binding protein